MISKIALGAQLAAALLWPAAGIADSQIADAPASGLTRRSIVAIAYPAGSGPASVELKGTGLIPGAAGRAKVVPKSDVTIVEFEFQSLIPPTNLGPELLTFVLWTISPEGRAVNLGGIPYRDKRRGQYKATTSLRSFSLLLTAEPYSAVRQPSEKLVLENAVRDSDRVKGIIVNDYKLVKCSQYAKLGNPQLVVPDLKTAPIEIYEARNAMDIAVSHAAEKYAPDLFIKAEDALRTAEKALARKASRNDLVSAGRMASQLAEDARALSVERQEKERIAAEQSNTPPKTRSDGQEREFIEPGNARTSGENEAPHNRRLAAPRGAAFKAITAAIAAEIRAQTDIAAPRLQAGTEFAQTDAGPVRRETVELRARLLKQFSGLLETRDTPQGLVIRVGDTLFSTGNAALTSDARERLARFAGIILAHPGLKIEVDDGDSAGTQQDPIGISHQRAQAVVNYLFRLGLEEDCIAPVSRNDVAVEDNSTPLGRQRNQPVELVVSGDAIQSNDR